MPNLFYYGPKMTKEQKAEMAKRLTETCAEITKIPAQAFIVTITETEPENVSVGGVLLADRPK